MVTDSLKLEAGLLSVQCAISAIESESRLRGRCKKGEVGRRSKEDVLIFTQTPSLALRGARVLGGIAFHINA